jgi:hypothetical protein
VGEGEGRGEPTSARDEARDVIIVEAVYALEIPKEGS